MEQQCISIAKAGVVCNLPCKTTVIAAANPCGGHYDKSKTVTENLKISGPLLSRFDLLFILLDNPNEELDYKLSSHIILLHSSKKSTGNAPNKLYVSSKNESISIDESKSGIEDPERNALLNRIKMDPNELQEFEPVLAPLLRKVKLNELF
jgi:DNA helicase MCM8